MASEVATEPHRGMNPGQEAVRLVVWDLDETFWKGTLSEGGIREYVIDHHNLVIELARRGIISSICSKNDQATVMRILREFGIADYFVFPSVSWDTKGPRVAALIEAFQLRAETVMFVDDNPSNRAEIAAVVPGIQIESETFLTEMLDDERFVGKDDRDLTRLAQYRLLETRKRDQESAPGTNEDFLRSCNIRVSLEYDVDTHIDRAIELINRTNQLNYTKRRLPEDVEQARHTLRAELSRFGAQGALVSVNDDYGEYGFVGFFLMKPGRKAPTPEIANMSLLHFAFSCRTLGMFVEQWVYNHLRRPQLEVVGEVLTDLSIDRNIDWITLVKADNDGPLVPADRVENINVVGGCEANAIGAYLGPYARQTRVIGNFSASGLFVRVNSCRMILSASRRQTPEFAAETKRLNLPFDLLSLDIFENAPEGTIFALSPMRDAEKYSYYRHRTEGWEIHFHPVGQDAMCDVLSKSYDEFVAAAAEWRYLSVEEREHLVATWRHLSANYESATFGGEEDRKSSLRALLDRIPIGCKAVIYLDQDRWRRRDGTLIDAPWVRSYAQLAREVVRDYPFTTIVTFDEAIEDDNGIHVGGNHVNRAVYLRMASLILAAASATPPRTPLLREAAE